MAHVIPFSDTAVTDEVASVLRTVKDLGRLVEEEGEEEEEEEEDWEVGVDVVVIGA